MIALTSLILPVTTALETQILCLCFPNSIRTTGCPKVDLKSKTPLNFYIAAQIMKPFKSCHHMWGRIFWRIVLIGGCPWHCSK